MASTAKFIYGALCWSMRWAGVPSRLIPETLSYLSN
jgi:hypothetical protein